MGRSSAEQNLVLVLCMTCLLHSHVFSSYCHCAVFSPVPPVSCAHRSQGYAQCHAQQPAVRKSGRCRAAADKGKVCSWPGLAKQPAVRKSGRCREAADKGKVCSWPGLAKQPAVRKSGRCREAADKGKVCSWPGLAKHCCRSSVEISL